MRYQFFCYSLALTVFSLLSVGAMAMPLPRMGAQAVDLPAIDSTVPLSGVSPEQLEEEATELTTGESATEVDLETAPVMPLNLSPETIEQSPVLQRWLESFPDVQSDIRNDPSFTTRIQAGYTFFPSSGGTSGFVFSVDDVFLGDTPLTVSADYQTNFTSGGTSSEQYRLAYGADLHYYLLPLGGYFNISPIVGYRRAESGNDYNIDGAHVGVRARFVPSRTGAADITLDQSWLVGDSERLNITQLNLGYAITQDLRLSTDFEWQRTPDEGDSRVGINLEWSL